MTKEMSLYGGLGCLSPRPLRLTDGVLEGVLGGSMIDPSNVFCINRLGSVPTPRNTAPFQSQQRGAGVYRHQARGYSMVR
jgi:hypothetical protein